MTEIQKIIRVDDDTEAYFQSELTEDEQPVYELMTLSPGKALLGKYVYVLGQFIPLANYEEALGME